MSDLDRLFADSPVALLLYLKQINANTKRAPFAPETSTARLSYIRASRLCSRPSARRSRPNALGTNPCRSGRQVEERSAHPDQATNADPRRNSLLPPPHCDMSRMACKGAGEVGAVADEVALVIHRRRKSQGRRSSSLALMKAGHCLWELGLRGMNVCLCPRHDHFPCSALAGDCIR